MGFLRNNEIDDAAKAIDSADLAKMDEEIRESVTQIQGWLQRCEELKCDLICVYY